MDRSACLRVLAASALALLAGCAAIDPYVDPPVREHLGRPDAVGDCARRLQALDRELDAAGVRDAQDSRVPGFPYLRVDRLTASLAVPAEDETRWAVWRERLARLDRAARHHELRNATPAGNRLPTPAQLDGCREMLIAADDEPGTRDARRAALRDAARVPDDYSLTLRAIGLYPLTRLAFAAGVRRWHDATLAVFATPLPPLPLEGVLRTYQPLEHPAPLARAAGSADGPAAAIATMSRDALGVPQGLPLSALLQRHAPRLEIDETGPHDRIGPLAIRHPDHPARVDPEAAPVAYVRLAWGRLGGVVRPQLVYTFWFPARPASHPLDLLAGELDALVWRVTLDDDGEALIYDTIHACGCYHLFFPTARVRPRPMPPPGQGLLDEGLFMPQGPLPRVMPHQRVVLRVASRTHYLQRVRLIEPASMPAVTDIPLHYRLLDEDQLRSLPLTGTDGAWRSVYDARGLVPGSERLERYVFWPMGIASAGQMRQWGRHATAFVGRRHFDDPDLLERYVELVDPVAPDRGE